VSIGRVRLDGTKPELLAEEFPAEARNFLTDGEALYYNRPKNGDPFVGELVRDPIEAGDTTILASKNGQILGLDEGYLYFSSNGLRRVPVSGGPEQFVASNVGEVDVRAFDATHVYFSGSLSQSISKVPKAGGPVETIVPGNTWPQVIAVDETCVYWIEANGQGALKKAPR
jgi:hypothetical protein